VVQVLKLLKEAGGDMNLMRRREPRDTPLSLLLRHHGGGGGRGGRKRGGGGHHRVVVETMKVLVELGGKWDDAWRDEEGNTQGHLLSNM